MSKRTRHEGSLYQRKDGLWCGSLSLGHADGKRRRVTVYGATLEEARAKLEAAKTRTSAGLARIRYHDLRHSYATLMLELGESPKVVQEMLGHSSVSITLGTYSHVSPALQRQAVARLDQLLG